MGRILNYLLTKVSSLPETNLNNFEDAKRRTRASSDAEIQKEIMKREITAKELKIQGIFIPKLNELSDDGVKLFCLRNPRLKIFACSVSELEACLPFLSKVHRLSLENHVEVKIVCGIKDKSEKLLFILALNDLGDFEENSKVELSLQLVLKSGDFGSFMVPTIKCLVNLEIIQIETERSYDSMGSSVMLIIDSQPKLRKLGIAYTEGHCQIYDQKKLESVTLSLGEAFNRSISLSGNFDALKNIDVNLSNTLDIHNEYEGVPCPPVVMAPDDYFEKITVYNLKTKKIASVKHSLISYRKIHILPGSMQSFLPKSKL